MAILELFTKARRPLSAQAVIDALSKEIDQATIYRTFVSLRKVGIITQIDLRHNHAHYELTNIKEHHHLICVHCGRIEDVHRCEIHDIEPTILASSKHFATITQHALEFYGVCKSCARKEDAVQ